MTKQERRAGYASLWVLALAFGWIEASVVVYLRELYAREVSLQGPDSMAGLQITLVSMPSHLVVVEIAREACTILLLGAVAWLAGRRLADRAGAFLLSFGIWDLTYYAVLRLVSGWPDTLRSWDILFLIPVPWVAPVWAPVSVAILFVAAGTYLFWTSGYARRYRWSDIGVLVTSALLVITAFLAESSAAIDQRTPERFPVWLFMASVVLGAVWFLRIEFRVARKRDAWRPARGVSAVSRQLEEADGSRLIQEYAEAKRRLDELVNEAGDLGERFERLARGLSAHPTRLIVGLPDGFANDATELDVVPSHPLPRIESLATLTDDIREAALSVDALRERLILLGHADAVEKPDEFFQ